MSNWSELLADHRKAVLADAEDKDALDRIAHLVKEDREGEGWTDMSGIIESISNIVESTGRDVSPHE